MTVLELMRRDAKFIQEKGGFQTSILFENINDFQSASIMGTSFVIHLSVDSEGQPINSRKAHLTICEKSLTDLNFKTRNYDNEIFLKNYLVSFADASGLVKKYKVIENFSDESTGTISLILKSFGN